jgi:predicted alpha-1,2-mannosidase
MNPKNLRKLFLPLPLGVACAIMATSLDAGQDLIDYVDPEIGTAHSRWFFYTPAAVPHGMAKLAPSTDAHEGNPSGWEAVGYDPRHSSLAGFVHFHEWQVGGVCFMPTVGPLQTKPGSRDDPDSGYRSRYDREKQISQPGFYQAHLADSGIDVELTATKRVGFHRYTFPASDASRVVLDIGNTQGESGQVTDAAIRMIDDRHFEGFVKTYPKYVENYDPEGTVNMYFHGELDKKPSGTVAFNDEGILENKTAIEGKGAGLVLTFDTEEREQIGIKVGLSYTAIDAARKNFEAEAATLSFDEAKDLAQSKWNQALGHIAIEDPDEDNKTKFYTGLFHALLGRGVANDVNGDYPKFDGTTGHLPAAKDDPKQQFLNTDAAWGTYWNLTQLWALSYPDWYASYVSTQLRIFEDKGWFADGVANSAYASGVGTNMVGLVVAAAYQTGILDHDVEAAYLAVRQNELGWEERPVGSGKMDLKPFVESGYVPFVKGWETNEQGSGFSASHTLEYSFSAYAAAQMAHDLGKTEDFEQLTQLSDNWRSLYNPENQVMQPKKADGKFIEDFDSEAAWRGFQEGNAIQYSFFVPHNPTALIETIGRGAFNDRLSQIFEISEEDDFSGGKTIDAFAGVQSPYNHGNQPGLHISWLFNFSGKPWLTQKWTRRICDEFYGTGPIHGYGRGQDEDQGQLGAWFVITSLGLFDVKGLTDSRPILQLGSPLFVKATIQLPEEKTLIIETKNNSQDNVYVQSATFNGEPVENCWLYRDELMQGGTLAFVMGDQPNKEWGVATPPPSAPEID